MDNLDPNAQITVAQFKEFTQQIHDHYINEQKAERQRNYDRQIERERNQLRRQGERDQLQDNERAEKKAETEAKAIPPCDGMDQEALRSWIREVDMSRESTPLTLYVAKLASRGSLKRSIAIFKSMFTNSADATWERCKTHIEKIFLSPRENDRMKDELKTIKQGAYESIPAYCMRFRELAEEAYKTVTDPFGLPVPRHKEIEDIILDAFVAGLYQDSMAERLINFGEPKTYLEAIAKVSEYDANNSRLSITRRLQRTRQEEPMDISAVNTPPKNDDISELKRQVCGLTSQFTKLMATMKQTSTQAAETPRAGYDIRQRQDRPRRPQPQSTPGPSHRYTSDGRPICAYCNIAGHIARVCRKRLASNEGSARQHYGNSRQQHGNQGGR